jgi:hypothetical protein
MATPLDDVCCARLPLGALPALAPVRCLPGVGVTVDGERAWVRWAAGDGAVLRCVLPVLGVEMYVRHKGHWYRLGSRLPCSGVPDGAAAVPLDRLLVPGPVQAEFVLRPEPRTVTLRLVRDARLRSATALRCDLSALANWLDRATSARLAALRAARSGGQVLLLGHRLPPLADGERFWGERLLVPLGHRPEPGLPERALCEALGVSDDQIALLGADGFEVLPRDAFGPLTRAGVRLALRERP